MSTKIFLTMAALPLVVLAGCSSESGPWPMPTGYAYHNNPYKAPPGPEPDGPPHERTSPYRTAMEEPAAAPLESAPTNIIAPAPAPAPLPIMPADGDAYRKSVLK